MKEQFEVIKIENQSMQLKINRSDTCHSCSAKSGCGTGVLSNYFDRYSVFNAPSQKNVMAGDIVTLEIPTGELFFRAFLLYIMPLMVLFVGSYVGMILFPTTEIWHIFIGFIGFVFALLFVKLFY